MARVTKTIEIEGLGALELRIPTRARFWDIQKRFSRPHQAEKRVVKLVEASMSKNEFRRVREFSEAHPDRCDDALAQIVHVVGQELLKGVH